MTAVSAQPVVVIYSGGMDSFTLLHRAREAGRQVHALSFDYGQRHRRELACAARVCAALGLSHKVVDIRGIHQLLQGSSLTDALPVPEGHYEEASMKSTVVPNRNMILLSLAVGYAVSLQAGEVWYGAHGGDHAIYPDCRPLFVERMDALCQIANYEPVRIVAPYLQASKGEILADGLRMGLDYADTWTCYNGQALACGRCGACVERLEAFAQHGLTDPVPYRQEAD
ncbi:MAG: 7-cyano-7-deazaguanine synthase QueC [Gammaproteobacteria bacterium]|nr:7-cyano-7-deazaguanine synthase QueC [Gammaproteobacteria bacterium]